MKRILISNGLQIAYKEWGSGNSRKVLGLHGWLDNANSFNQLGPVLANHDCHFIAIDHLGHGHSSHLEPSANYHLLRNVVVVREVLDQLQWEKIDLIGHSMGSSIAILFSATNQERIRHLVLIEGFGPLIAEAEDAPRNLKKALEAEIKHNQRTTSGKIYPTFGDAVQARMNAVRTYPGEQYISKEAVLELVGRGTKLVNTEIEDTYEDIVDESFGPVRFRHDTKVMLPSYSYQTKEQVYAYLNAIEAKTLLVKGDKGWPLHDLKHRESILKNKNLLESVVLSGSHHLHLDPLNAMEVSQTIATFLTQSTSTI